MHVFSQSAGLFTEGDLVSLSGDLVVSRGRLIDVSNTAQHQLHPKAEKVLSYIQTEHKVEYFIDAMDLFGMTASQISEIILFINSIGGFEVSRSIIPDVQLAVKRCVHRLCGFRLQTISRRSSANIWGLSKLLSRAILPVIFLVTATGLIEFGANLSVEVYLVANIIFVTCLWVSTLVHELIHIKFARLFTNRVTVLQRGLRIGILHLQTPRRNELLSAFAGPISGMFVAVLVAYGCYSFDQLVAMVYMVAIALFHLLSWLPAYGDGKTIKTLLDRRMYETAS